MRITETDQFKKGLQQCVSADRREAFMHALAFQLTRRLDVVSELSPPNQTRFRLAKLFAGRWLRIWFEVKEGEIVLWSVSPGSQP